MYIKKKLLRQDSCDRSFFTRPHQIALLPPELQPQEPNIRMTLPVIAIALRHSIELICI